MPQNQSETGPIKNISLSVHLKNLGPVSETQWFEWSWTMEKVQNDTIKPEKRQQTVWVPVHAVVHCGMNTTVLLITLLKIINNLPVAVPHCSRSYDIYEVNVFRNCVLSTKWFSGPRLQSWVGRELKTHFTLHFSRSPVRTASAFRVI
jgi:hypothetical protein